MAKPHAHIRLDFSGTCSIGPGKIGLLEGIQRTGSLSAAARALGMSYRRAWLLLHNTNEGFQEPVVELSVGGRDGGGTQLTEFGRRLVADYRAFEASVDQLAAAAFESIQTSGRPPAESASGRRPVARALPRRGRGAR
ncbi:MAG TPA: winged helix-turn-helix domain-containing protein [Steroidobacteraceae bacterium]|nr:winged helix-turn-helix domain-containing protein [Steroidobacteraceae bacterium]